MKSTTPDSAPDAWEANRDRQLRFWMSVAPERRALWLEEAVAAAYRSGALPRRTSYEDTSQSADSLLPPLVGSAAMCARGDVARRAWLGRLSAYFRGPCPPAVDAIVFAEYGVLVQFALWRQTDAAFWCEMAEANADDVIAQAARSDSDLRIFLEKPAGKQAHAESKRLG